MDRKKEIITKEVDEEKREKKKYVMLYERKEGRMEGQEPEGKGTRRQEGEEHEGMWMSKRGVHIMQERNLVKKEEEVPVWHGNVRHGIGTNTEKSEKE